LQKKIPNLVTLFRVVKIEENKTLPDLKVVRKLMKPAVARQLLLVLKKT
jgi:hypothetical protein